MPSSVLTTTYVAAVLLALLIAGIGYVLWWHFGPGAVGRRKQSRRDLWMKVKLNQLKKQGYVRKHHLAPRPGWGPRKAQKLIEALKRKERAELDRDVFEREVRRWD